MNKTKTTKSKVTFTTIYREHLTRIVAIEKSNSQKANPLGGEWSRKDFISVLAIPSHNGIVAWKDSKIVGFLIYCLCPDIIHISNMAVDPNYLNQGVGTQLLDKMKSKLNIKRRTELEIDIRESNLHAQLFLRNRGFKAICVCRGWYEKPEKEDCYKFQYTILN